MEILQRGRYQAAFATEPAQLAAVQQLRSRVFRNSGLVSDQDQFDAQCRHVLVSVSETGQVVCGFRLLFLGSGAEIEHSYSAQFYDLSGFHSAGGALLELGRFCVDPDLSDPDILRIAWGFLTGIIDRNQIKILFGCASFAGTQPENYRQGFALLGKKYPGPADRTPGVKAAEIHAFDQLDPVDDPNLRRAMNTLPPLLRTYLAMGGWVSDHAVIDRDLGTLHVFTCLDISAIPQLRAQRLRAISE